MSQRSEVTELDIEPLKDGTGRARMFVTATGPDGQPVKMVAGGKLYLIRHNGIASEDLASAVFEFVPMAKEGG